MLDRIVYKAGDIHANIFPCFTVDFDQFLEAVFPGFIIAAILDENVLIVQEIIGQDPVSLFPVDRFFEPFKVIHFNFSFRTATDLKI